MSVPDAIAPVMNGNTSEPTDPKLEIQPMPPEMSSWGRTRPAWFITIGYMGPRKKPTKEMLTALEMRCGTRQTTSSSLCRMRGRKRGACVKLSSGDDVMCTRGRRTRRRKLYRRTWRAIRPATYKVVSAWADTDCV